MSDSQQRDIEAVLLTCDGKGKEAKREALRQYRAALVEEIVAELEAMRRELHHAGHNWDSTLGEAITRIRGLAAPTTEEG